ncbi:tryptophan-rich sensory protein [Candidatus Woesearchaeota archaeon]|jgi:translocator protein|nr:tryptophan-rich sensory protein [Candidatus Woesearchaeota archaeon]MBT4368228.1 tryptophan-rich sensory protein [Candidatus Woesearchaeota archaeon]MBT4712717.1 tryptophan-rich sensory protein [Candidatus Woesearchaeota archaeon]MBT6639629.1 tryptophan-rich sensory protein [Candidatus Woesearchaeota archaeon]MBT7133801.1 tryptophan-rich sensory protein [Candidatus Woesearchaeota archaeon]
MNKIWKLIISLVLPFIASAIGGLFTVSSVSTWYVDLVKPSFNPPSWLFGPVWTILYLLMGIALYLVWTKKFNKQAFTLFGIQLVLNALWSILFFGLKQPLLAFIEIIILWVMILVTIIYFYKINKNSAYLLIPYLLWVSFAAILNLAIFILN